jgi:hypothetical protein
MVNVFKKKLFSSNEDDGKSSFSSMSKYKNENENVIEVKKLRDNIKTLIDEDKKNNKLLDNKIKNNEYNENNKNVFIKDINKSADTKMKIQMKIDEYKDTLKNNPELKHNNKVKYLSKKVNDYNKKTEKDLNDLDLRIRDIVSNEVQKSHEDIMKEISIKNEVLKSNDYTIDKKTKKKLYRYINKETGKFLHQMDILQKQVEKNTKEINELKKENQLLRNNNNILYSRLDRVEKRLGGLEPIRENTNPIKSISITQPIKKEKKQVFIPDHEMSEEGLNDLTKKQLLSICKKYKIKGSLSKMNKGQLINELTSLMKK